MSPAASIFEPCLSSSIDADAEIIVVSPMHHSTKIDLWAPPQKELARSSPAISTFKPLNEILAGMSPHLLRSPASPVRRRRERKPLDEILAGLSPDMLGLSPKNPHMPRNLDQALEFKQHHDEQQLFRRDPTEYDEVIHEARLGSAREQLDLDLEAIKTYRPQKSRQNACDVPSRIWQWLVTV